MCSMGTPVTLRQARSCLIFAIADKRLRSGSERWIVLDFGDGRYRAAH